MNRYRLSGRLSGPPPFLKNQYPNCTFWANTEDFVNAKTPREALIKKTGKSTWRKIKRKDYANWMIENLDSGEKTYYKTTIAGRDEAG